MWVWRWYPPKAKEKLGLGWTGPFKVVERIGESAVRIMRDSKVLVVHTLNLMKEGNSQVAKRRVKVNGWRVRVRAKMEKMMWTRVENRC